jgi:hypothetical protein
MASKFLSQEEILAKIYEEEDVPAPYNEDGTNSGRSLFFSIRGMIDNSSICIFTCSDPFRPDSTRFDHEINQFYASLTFKIVKFFVDYIGTVTYFQRKVWKSCCRTVTLVFCILYFCFLFGPVFLIRHVGIGS